MVKRIIWTKLAVFQRREILQYWTSRNKSKSYSVKLNKLFQKGTQLLKTYPDSGKLTDYKGIRVKIIRDYYLYYKVNNEALYIIAIFDVRRNPIITKNLFS